jgi:ribosome maturation factor RimP
MDLKERVRDLVEGVIEDMGYKLVDIQFGSEGGKFALIIKIDKEGGPLGPSEAGAGVNVEDCAQVSRVIDPILEEANLIEKSWVLIVSSPGITD